VCGPLTPCGYLEGQETLKRSHLKSVSVLMGAEVRVCRGARRVGYVQHIRGSGWEGSCMMQVVANLPEWVWPRQTACGGSMELLTVGTVAQLLCRNTS